MNMKIIEWIKSLFKKEIKQPVQTEKEVKVVSGFSVVNTPKQDTGVSTSESFTTPEEIKPKKRKRGRPRKKKMEVK